MSRYFLFEPLNARQMHERIVKVQISNVEKETFIDYLRLKKKQSAPFNKSSKSRPGLYFFVFGERLSR